MTLKRSLRIAQVSRMAEILKTIGHPVRLDILLVLEANGPLSVGEIRRKMEAPIEQSLLSHHLIKLKDRGVLEREKQGLNVVYSLVDRHVLRLFDCLENCGDLF